jgi:MFS family permease
MAATGSSGAAASMELVGWRDPRVLTAAAFAAAAGFAQFGVTATLGDVAAAFGRNGSPTGVAAQVGMSGTTLGIGLAVIRLAALASMPVAGLADRFGRRRLLAGCALAGLAITATASLVTVFWAFVLVLAAARPLLTGANALAGVIAAEETASRSRAAALALVGAAYSLGTGAISVLRGVAGDTLGFRGVFALTLVPVVVLAAFARSTRDTPRFHATPAVQRRRLGAVPRTHLPRLLLVATLTAAVGLVVGPVFTYLFVYGERVLGASPGQMAVLVLVAGPAGLIGLLVGRIAADQVGRRVTAAAAMILLGVGGIIAYNDGPTHLIIGYLLAIVAAAAVIPSGGALDSEIFPTSIRATAAGWVAAAAVAGSVAGLAVFGILADATGTFRAAAITVCLPAILLAALYRWLPETRGLELERSAPEPVATTTGAPSDGVRRQAPQ